MDRDDRERQVEAERTTGAEADRPPAEADDDAEPAGLRSWVPWGGGGGLAFLPARGDDVDAESAEDGGHRFLDEEFISAVILVGAVLFVVPEPITSSVGVALILFGAAAWVLDAYRNGI